MSIILYLLVGVHLSGAIQPLYLFNNKESCQKAIYQIESLSDKPSHVYCMKLLVNEV